MDENSVVRRRGNALKWILAAVLLIVLVSFNIPVPYFVYVPGEAMELPPLVHVENADQDNTGTLMLTTVSRVKGTIASYAWAYISPYADLMKKEVVLQQNETPEEYNERQLFMMKNSKQDAIIASFTAIGQKITVENRGVYVVSLSENMPAEKVLNVGDVITEINGQPVRTRKELLEIMKPFKVGDEIKLTYLRDNKTTTSSVVLAALPKEPGEKEVRAGLGIIPATDRNLKLDRKVDIETERIGGPSAGLMFTLELIDQLTDGNLTKGYRIAGTGTIDPEGNVGQIGGIHLKIIAADKKKADIFFAPKDIVPATDHYPGDTNERDAKAMAKKIGTDMKVVPVASLKEALDYLKKLPPK